MICLFHKRHRLGGVVRRGNLISGHATKETSHPTRGFTPMCITICIDFHIDTIVCTTIVLLQTIAFAHRRHEIRKRYRSKQGNAIYVWQNLLKIERHI